jgi:hypothetical protein
MLPLAALGALKGVGGGGGGMPGLPGLPGMSDQSMSSASATVNLAGMQVGGGYGQTSDIPAFLRSRLGGSSSEDGPRYAVPMLLIAAGLTAFLLFKK